MPSEAEIGRGAEEEVVEIQVGGVERVVEAPTQAKGFDLSRETSERLSILLALAISDRRHHALAAFRVDQFNVARKSRARHLTAAENLHRGHVHVGGGEQAKPARH